MKLFDIYTWATGKQASFLNNFNGNDQLYAQAQQFWNTLESNAIVYFAIFFLLGIGLAYYYYTPFNNQPGRHYHPKWWGIFLGVCFVSTLLLTLGAAYLIATPKLDGAFTLELKLSLVNSLYACVLYVLTSWVYCNWLPTNAYRLLK